MKNSTLLIFKLPFQTIASFSSRLPSPTALEQFKKKVDLRIRWALCVPPAMHCGSLSLQLIQHYLDLRPDHEPPALDLHVVWLSPVQYTWDQNYSWFQGLYNMRPFPKTLRGKVQDNNKNSTWALKCVDFGAICLNFQKREWSTCATKKRIKTKDRSENWWLGHKYTVK